VQAVNEWCERRSAALAPCTCYGLPTCLSPAAGGGRGARRGAPAAAAARRGGAAVPAPAAPPRARRRRGPRGPGRRGGPGARPGRRPPPAQQPRCGGGAVRRRARARRPARQRLLLAAGARRGRAGAGVLADRAFPTRVRRPRLVACLPLYPNLCARSGARSALSRTPASRGAAAARAALCLKPCWNPTSGPHRAAGNLGGARAGARPHAGRVRAAAGRRGGVHPGGPPHLPAQHARQACRPLAHRGRAAGAPCAWGGTRRPCKPLRSRRNSERGTGAPGRCRPSPWVAELACSPGLLELGPRHRAGQGRACVSACRADASCGAGACWPCGVRRRGVRADRGAHAAGRARARGGPALRDQR
jgi:hypothetical protein